MSYLKQLIVGATATGAGTPFMFDQPRCFEDVSLQGVFSGATDVQVDVELSLDGIHWSKFTAWGPGRQSGEHMDAGRMGASVGIRANVVLISGSSSPSIDLWFAQATRE